MPSSALRVVAIGDLQTASYCALLLGNFGSEIIDVEPVAGDSGRRARRGSAMTARLSRVRQQPGADDLAADLCHWRKESVLSRMMRSR